MSEGIRGIKQHNIQIPVQCQVLKSIIEEHHLRPEVLAGITPAAVAILANEDGDSWEGLCQQIGLIPDDAPGEARAIACRHYL
jgi:hypothetical protein